MTMCKEEPAKCQQCGHEQQFTVWDTINVTLNPELKEQYLKSELTTFVCEKCGCKAQVVYPMLYHDMGKRFMIWLAKEAEGQELDKLASFMAGQMKNYRFREVHSRNELIEKIYIFDAGLDDRIVELLKLMLVTMMEEGDKEVGELRFERVEEENEEKTLIFVLLGNHAPKRTGLLFAAYDEVAARFADALSDGGEDVGKYLRVDVKYANSLLAPPA